MRGSNKPRVVSLPSLRKDPSGTLTRKKKREGTIDYIRNGKGNIIAATLKVLEGSRRKLKPVLYFQFSI